MTGARPTRKTLKRCLIALVALVVSGILGELAYRGLRRLQGRPYDSAAVARTLTSLAGGKTAARDPAARRAIAEAAQIASADGTRIVLHPYFGFDVSSDTGLQEETRPCGAPADAQRRLDVLVLGGSVAQMLAEANCQVLADAIAADPRLSGAPVAIHSYARAGFKEPQHVIVLAYLFARGLECDLVVLVDGFNEVALGNMNATHDSSPLFPALAHWAFLSNTRASDLDAIDILVELRSTQQRTARFARIAAALGVEHSAVLGDLALAVLGPLRNRSVELQQRFERHARADSASSPTLRGPNYPADPGSRFELMARNWSESSRSIDAMCRARGIAYLHVLQPTLHYEGSKPLTAEERRTGTGSPEWVEGVHEGYPRLRAAGAALRASGVDFVDLSMVFRDVEEPVYFDVCHLNEAGNAILAREIAAAIRREVKLPREASGR